MPWRTAVPEDTAHLPAGVTFPGVVVGGTVYTAANVAKSWIGQPLAEPAAAKLKRKVVAINDADAAGLAEVHFGAARDVMRHRAGVESRHRHRQRAVRRRQAGA